MSINGQLKTDIIQWDVESWARCIHFWDRAVDWTKVDRCLEIGAREGGLSLWLALKGKSVVCSNNEKTKKLAEPLHQRYKLVSHVDYQDIDATRIPYEGHFDLVVFKSVLGAIGEGNKEVQRGVVNEIHKALKRDGVMLFAENLCASPLHRYFRKRFTRWSGYWTYPSLREIRSFMQDFTSFDIHTTGVLANFGRSESQRQVLSQFDKVLLNHITPPAWRYIAYGVARK